MKRSYSTRDNDALMERYTRREKRHRFRFFSYILMLIGAGTVVVALLRYVIIPILIYFGGTVS